MVELSLSTSSDPVAEECLRKFLADSYGLHGRFQRLGGEKDDNFVSTAPGGESHLVKVAHAQEDSVVVELQTAVLEYLRRAAPDLPAQRVLPNLDGHLDAAASEGPLAGRRVRVTTYLRGDLLGTVAGTSALRREVGSVAARLDRALLGFDHEGLHRPLLWDVGQAATLRPLLDELPAGPERQLLERVLSRFLSDVLPRLSSLRRQAVHNDLSGDNLLVAPEGNSLAGILDFGDVVYSQLINEVAVAASYQLTPGPDLVAKALDVVASYHEINPLTREEISLLLELIVGRVLAWVIIPRWRSARVPSNNPYVLRNAERSWSLLRALLDVSPEDFANRLRRVGGVSLDV